MKQILLALLVTLGVLFLHSYHVSKLQEYGEKEYNRGYFDGETQGEVTALED